MPHILDPKRLSTDEDYHAAQDELERLLDVDRDTPGGWRFDELAALIDDYEGRRQRSNFGAHADAHFGRSPPR